jgi:hypothetical protein
MKSLADLLTSQGKLEEAELLYREAREATSEELGAPRELADRTEPSRKRAG